MVIFEMIFFCLFSVIYPGMFHLTCLCHLLHNVAMKIQSTYPLVNDIISSLKACTIKNKTRADYFKDLGSVPDPVTTRWGTWITAALWYAEHWVQVREIVLGFEGEGVLVTKVIAAFSAPGVAAQLVEISRVYAELPALILQLEHHECTQLQGYQKIQSWVTTIENEEAAKDILVYLKSRLSKMPDLQKLIDPPDDCDPNIISLLQRSPASDAVIERSFSKLRKLLASDRNFADENLPDYVIGFVNSSE